MYIQLDEETRDSLHLRRIEVLDHIFLRPSQYDGDLHRIYRLAPPIPIIDL